MITYFHLISLRHWYHTTFLCCHCLHLCLIRLHYYLLSFITFITLIALPPPLPAIYICINAYAIIHYADTPHWLYHYMLSLLPALSHYDAVITMLSDYITLMFIFIIEIISLYMLMPLAAVATPMMPLLRFSLRHFRCCHAAFRWWLRHWYFATPFSLRLRHYARISSISIVTISIEAFITFW